MSFDRIFWDTHFVFSILMYAYIGVFTHMPREYRLKINLKFFYRHKTCTTSQRMQKITKIGNFKTGGFTVDAYYG